MSRWRTVIMSIGLEEMLHLALVSNLLTALGAAPHLRRPPFPQESRYYPAGITIELQRFSDATLTRFIHLERPEGATVEDVVHADPAVDLEAGVPSAAPGALRAPEDEVEEVPAEAYATVGHLYEAIGEGFRHLVDHRGEADIFLGPPESQARPEHFRFPGLVPVTDLASAQRALAVLVEQGEGVRGDWSEAHYGKFLEVRKELRALVAEQPAFDAARPVLANPLAREPAGGAPGRLVEDSSTAAVMELFDNCYELMTEMLLRFFSHTDESEEALTALARGAITLMAVAVAPLGGLLTRLPAGAPHGDATAGPGFHLHRSVNLIPHRRAAWVIFHERLGELAAFAARLAEDVAQPLLVEVGAALADVARALEPHLDREPALATPPIRSER